MSSAARRTRWRIIFRIGFPAERATGRGPVRLVGQEGSPAPAIRAGSGRAVHRLGVRRQVAFSQELSSPAGSLRPPRTGRPRHHPGVCHARLRRRNSNRNAIATIGSIDGNLAAMKLEYLFGMNRVHMEVSGWARAFAGLGLAVMLLIPCVSGAQPTDAEASPAALPSVFYPDRLPATAPPPPALPLIAPPIPDAGGQIIWQQVDGVWGYWDGYRHFHRRPDVAVRPRPVVRTVVRPHPIEIVRHSEGRRG
jgi:hypothetical protein